MSDIYQDQEKIAEMQEAGDVIQSEDDAARIMEYVLTETEKIADGEEMKKMQESLKKWRRQREARPEQEQKDFPWPGASNVSVPLSMMNGNGVFSMLKNSIGSRDPFFKVKPTRGNDYATPEALEHLLDLMVESPYHLNLRQVNNTILYELATIGTQFVKVPWVIDRWQFKRRSTGGGLENVIKTRKDSPGIVPVRAEDFLCRPFYDDIQRAPLIGQRIYLFEHELRQREAQGIYRNVDKVLEGGGLSELPDAKKDQLERMGISPDEGRDMKLYEIHEIYTFQDIDNDGIPEDIILWIDPVTETFLRTEFNDLGVRPWVKFSYLQRPYQLYGMGTGWMSEHLQDEIDALHNMRIDGTKLSMLQMYVTRKGSGVAPGETFRPLKNIQVANPKEDFMPIKFPSIGYDTIQAEMMAKEYSDRATGAGDYQMGFESQAAGTAATASGTMFLAQQGTKVQQSIQQSVEASFSELARIVVFQMVRNADRTRESLLPMLEESDASLLEENLLGKQVEDIPSAFHFSVKTTDIEQTEEARKQAMLTLTQLYTMYGEKVFNMLPMIYGPQAQQVPPEIKEVAAKFFIGSTKMMEEVFETFDVDNTQQYLPYIQNLQMMVQAIEQMKSEQVNQAGGGNVSQNSPQVEPRRGTGENPSGPSGGAGLGAPQGPTGGPQGGGPTGSGE
jgi:hypothetical protein